MWHVVDEPNINDSTYKTIYMVFRWDRMIFVGIPSFFLFTLNYYFRHPYPMIDYVVRIELPFGAEWRDIFLRRVLNLSRVGGL